MKTLLIKYNSHGHQMLNSIRSGVSIGTPKTCAEEYLMRIHPREDNLTACKLHHHKLYSHLRAVAVANQWGRVRIIN